MAFQYACSTKELSLLSLLPFKPNAKKASKTCETKIKTLISINRAIFFVIIFLREARSDDI